MSLAGFCFHYISHDGIETPKFLSLPSKIPPYLYGLGARILKFWCCQAEIRCRWNTIYKKGFFLKTSFNLICWIHTGCCWALYRMIFPSGNTIGHLKFIYLHTKIRFNNLLSKKIIESQKQGNAPEILKKDLERSTTFLTLHVFLIKLAINYSNNHSNWQKILLRTNKQINVQSFIIQSTGFQ